MNNRLVKTLVFGILMLFVGSSMIQTTAVPLNADKQSNSIINTEECNNYLGNMKAYWDLFWINPAVEIELNTNRVYSFPDNDGYVIGNFSFNWSTWTRNDLLIPRLSMFDVIIFDGDISDEPLENANIVIKEWVQKRQLMRDTPCFHNVMIDMNGEKTKTLTVQFTVGCYWLYILPFPKEIKTFEIEVRAV